MQTDLQRSRGPARLSRLLPLVLALAAGACAAPPPAIDAPRDGEAQMGLIGSAVVPALLDGREVDLILDTGSSASVIDASLAGRLGLAVDSTLIPHRYRFIAGTQLTRHTTTVERLEVGGMAVGPLELPLADLEAGGGMGGTVLLGCDVLRRCRILFEARAPGVRFLAARPPEEVEAVLRDLCPGRAFVPLEVTWTYGCPFVEVAQGAGPPKRFLVDTGALQTFVSEQTLRAWDPARGADAGAEAGLELLEDLSLGPWRAWIVAATQDSARSDALGFDVLSHLTFLWDGPGSRLWIAAPPPGEPGKLTAGFGIQQMLRDRGVEP